MGFYDHDSRAATACRSCGGTPCAFAIGSLVTMVACSILLFGFAVADRRLSRQIEKVVEAPLVIASCCAELHMHRLVDAQRVSLLKLCEEWDLTHDIGRTILDKLRGQQEHMLSLMQRPDLTPVSLADWWSIHYRAV